MPGPYRTARAGQLVDRRTSGFPMFFKKRRNRIITADPWALLEHLAASRLSASSKKEALAFIEQAFDFYEAASNPQLGSKPLLYYYSFLNAVKAGLLLRKVKMPPVVVHGIRDPRANIRERFRIEGQSLTLEGRASNHSEVFPEFLAMLGGQTSTRSIRVLSVFRQIPSIHRTFNQITGERPMFVPVSRIEIRRNKGRAWAHIAFDITDEHSRTLLGRIKQRPHFSKCLDQVGSLNEGEACFETEDRNAARNAADAAMAELARSLRQLHLSTILTRDGYRYYLSGANAPDYLSPLAASYAAFFYLGSITRYKPQNFDTLRAGKYGWLCEELLASQPAQFVYTLASELAETDVVRPQAVIS